MKKIKLLSVTEGQILHQLQQANKVVETKGRPSVHHTPFFFPHTMFLLFGNKTVVKFENALCLFVKLLGCLTACSLIDFDS